MIRCLALLGWLLCAAFPSWAEQDYLSSDGTLSDQAFYKMVACAAPVGEDCRTPLVRWPVNDTVPLRIGITRIEDSFPAQNATLISEALNAAIAQINFVDARVTLARNDTAPTIQVLLLDRPEKEELRDTGIEGLDGNWMDAAYVHIWWNDNHELVKGVIIISPSVQIAAIKSVVLEEVVQSLGLLTDIDNPAYSDNSIFDQNSNAVTQLRGQDAMALRRHYAD